MMLYAACIKIIEHNKTIVHNNPAQIHNMKYDTYFVIDAEEILEKASDSILNIECNADPETGVIVID